MPPKAGCLYLSHPPIPDARLLEVLPSSRHALCTCVGSIVVMTPGLFTNSAEVAAAMLGLIPLFCAVLIIHTASMATEGIMLAGAHHASAYPENMSLKHA